MGQTKGGKRVQGDKCNPLMLKSVYEIKLNGLEGLLEPLREKP
jgi:uncharacterized protein (DUF3820 family)